MKRLTHMELDRLRKGVVYHLRRTSKEMQEKLGMDFSVQKDDGGFEEVVSDLRGRGGLNELAELAHMGIDDVSDVFDGSSEGEGNEIDYDVLLSRLRECPGAEDVVGVLELMQLAAVLLICAHALQSGYMMDVNKEVVRVWQIKKEIDDMVDDLLE